MPRRRKSSSASAIRNRGPVLCYNSVESHGFAYWSSAADWVGQDGYLISFDDRPEEPDVYAEFFRRIELIAEFPMTRNGSPFHNVRLYHCIDQVQPFGLDLCSSVRTDDRLDEVKLRAFFAAARQ